MAISADTFDDVAKERVRDRVDGGHLRALMAAMADITIRALADRLGVEQRTVARWRAGHMDRLTWLGILHALGLPATWQPGDPLPPKPSGLDDVG